ncbi:hypothetical protein Ahy_A06g030247 [Arachis hypogaea]|uniref:Aminotransferase-like plant mobile domain-containing protein n=1 Tax=Arachis hypogaea TaxID=3818 RepID=A0A445CVU6_ARAHY|nr:hypothetical protein Ahy_A06g030247 [Arachis hypogaea]
MAAASHSREEGDTTLPLPPLMAALARFYNEDEALRSPNPNAETSNPWCRQIFLPFSVNRVLYSFLGLLATQEQLDYVSSFFPSPPEHLPLIFFKNVKALYFAGASLYFWCPITNNFHFPYGMMGPTLMDILALIALPVDGEFVLRLIDYSEDDFDINFELNSISNFIQIDMGSKGDPISDSENVAFLLLWLNSFVFCSKFLVLNSFRLPPDPYVFIGYSTQKFVNEDTTPTLSIQKFVDQDMEPLLHVPSQKAGDLYFDDIDFDLKNLLSEARQVYSYEGTIVMSSNLGLSTIIPQTEKLTQVASSKEEEVIKKITSSVSMILNPQVVDKINIILDCLNHSIEDVNNNILKAQLIYVLAFLNQHISSDMCSVVDSFIEDVSKAEQVT